MSDFAQYTVPSKRTITLSNLAKKWNISRKYGYTTQHVTRTAIYIYKHKTNELFKDLGIPKLEDHQRICFKCREVKNIKAFSERMAVCTLCRKTAKNIKNFKKDEESLKNCKIEINPYFLRRGNG
jgi:hypothetical protein